MTQTATTPVPAAPRSSRHEAICDAVFALLGEVGYDRMSMDAVAARARASKATIYRAWSHKRDMVIDALVHRLGGVPQAPDTGSLRGDLIALGTRACEIANSPDGAVVAGLMSVAALGGELGAALYRCTYQLKRVVHEAIIERAVARGELPSGTDPGLLHEVLHALVLSRRLCATGPLDADFVVHVVDDVLLPVLRRDSPDG